MVDIEKQSRTISDDERALIALINRYTLAIKDLKNRNVDYYEVEKLNSELVVNEFEAITKEKEQVDNAIRKSQKELSDVRPWGSFDTSLLKTLTERGYEYVSTLLTRSRLPKIYLRIIPLRL
jgi:V/A-type H+/Na+-transporting ATPase subunit I